MERQSQFSFENLLSRITRDLLSVTFSSDQKNSGIKNLIDRRGRGGGRTESEYHGLPPENC